MERGLRVRNEGFPARCEICHQSDSLDLETGECRRCRDLTIPDELLYVNHQEEKPTGFIIPFGRIRSARFVSGLLAFAFCSSLVGPAGGFFFASLCCFFVGLNRVIKDAELIGSPVIDLALNILIMSGGLAGCCFGGLYFLDLIYK
jgi:hypothetical protein